MKILQYRLRNFGSYRGENIFELGNSNREKPVILIGGRNGSGKTTFFEGIKCCLFGKRSRGHKIRHIEYQQYLLDRRSHNIGDDEITELELSFTMINHGREEHYLVKRSWWINDTGKLIEKFRVEKNKYPLTEIPLENWQNYIADLLPPQILDIFFFDSEDLKALAITEEEGSYLKNVFSTLFGLNYIDQLKQDLDLQLSNLESNGGKSVSNEITKSYERKEEINTEIENLNKERGQIKNSIQFLEKEIESLESKLSALGGDFARQRDKNLDRKVELETKISMLEATLQREMGQLLPFLIVKDMIEEVLDATEHELVAKGEREFKSLLEERVSSLTDPPFEVSHSGEWREKLVESLTKDLSVGATNYNISEKERGKILYEFSHLINHTEPVAIEAISEILTYREELNIILENLARAPAENEIKTVLDQIKSKSGEVEVLKQKYLKFKNNTEAYGEELKRIDKNLDILRKRIRVSDRVVKERIDSVQDILKEYREKILKRKCELIQDYILQNFKLICSKGEITSKIHLDPDTFTITLFDINGTPWKKNFLSEGEKQLLALSILWALVQLTGRNYPFIIDTPLGRLDEEHRDGLVNEFFGRATEQMIILSTNEEFDNTLYSKIHKQISRSYLLSYDTERMASKITENSYFNKQELIL